MKKINGRVLSRREFARHAAMLSATASIVPAGVMLEAPAQAVAAGQAQETGPKLSAEGQAEAEARYQQILSLYGDRFDEEQKTSLKKMCSELQQALERIRAYPLDNGDTPALYLKPLVEREKKPQSLPGKNPTAASPKKP